MPDVSPAVLVLALLAGAGLGAIYFGGLWWTVRRAGSFKRPAFSMLASVLLRMGVALGGFYLIASGSWQRMLFGLLGFVVGRAVVSWQVRHITRGAAAGVLHAP